MNKQELRKLYREKRQLLSDEEVEKRSAAVSNSFFKNIDLSTIENIHIFLPISHHKEFDTFILINEIWNRHPSIQLMVPKVEGENLKTHIYDFDTVLEKNGLGIPEPKDSPEVLNDEIDLVIIPLLAFDKKGNRIGYGKGYYDKFLSTCRADVIKVGLSFFEAEDSLPTDTFDVPLNFCVTPNKFYSF